MTQVNRNNPPQRNSMNVKYLLSCVGILFTGGLMAQNAQSIDGEDILSLFSNSLFNVLLGIIIFLIIVITVLAGVLKNVAAITKDKNKNNGKLLTVIGIVVFLSSGTRLVAQNAVATSSSGYSGLSDGLFYVMLCIIGFEILVITVLLNSIQLFIQKEKSIEVEKSTAPTLLEKLTASVAIEKEQDILLDHDYDGIRELDNDLPPWWKYGFYLTIVIGVIYLINYHVIKSGDLQEAEYNKSVEAARIAKEEYQKMNAENVNESSVVMLTDKAEIEKGGKIFIESCSVCHGKLGEGGVGPNLTDNYWLHGGSIVDVFKSVKYGWPDKGMKSWQADLPPIQIHQVSSYIMTLLGTNPPNAKALQGDLYTEVVAMPSDSTKTDSTAVQVITDSLKVALK